MRLRAILLLLLMLTIAFPAYGGGPAMIHHATGSFEVSMLPDAQDPGPTGGVPTSRLGLLKNFAGGLEGTATGTMIAAGTPKPEAAASYVAIDQFTGETCRPEHRC